MMILLPLFMARAVLAQRGQTGTAEEKRFLSAPAPVSKVVPCRSWIGTTGLDLYTLAVHPSMIGDSSNSKRCKIVDARKCLTCACDYYVRYSEDGGATWLGLDFNGNAGIPGATGCPGYGYTSATQTQAIAWLQDKYIDQGRCGCTGETCKWTNWIDRDNESGKGDYEFDPTMKNRCKVEKYEVTLVSGGPMYTNVASVPTNQLSYNPASSYANGPMVYCVNTEQPQCKTSSNGYKVGPSPPCCMDYKTRFCCRKPEPTCKWTNWIDRDNESGKGDYEFDPTMKNRCKVEKYEVTLVSGGPVYTNVASVPTNQLSYNPYSSYANGPMVYCVNTKQPRCRTSSNGWKVGPSPPCCMDYKVRFCCGNNKPSFPPLLPSLLAKRE